MRELGLDDPQVDDERTTTTSYAHGGNALPLWIIDQPDTVTITDENGKFVAKTVAFYDGDPLIGLQGQIQNRALKNRVIDYIDDKQFVQTVRKRFDAYGNAVEALDPLGNVRHIAYDPVFATFPISETMVVGGGSPDLILQAEYDYGHKKFKDEGEEIDEPDLIWKAVENPQRIKGSPGDNGLIQELHSHLLTQYEQYLAEADRENDDGVMSPLSDPTKPSFDKDPLSDKEPVDDGSHSPMSTIVRQHAFK